MKSSPTTFDLFTPWFATPQAFWERWRQAVENDEAPPPAPGGIWGMPLEFWKAAIYGGLEMELAIAESWKEWLCASDTRLPEFAAGACQTAHFLEDWTNAQTHLWDGWFTAVEYMMQRAPLLPAAPARSTARRHMRKPAREAPAGELAERKAAA